MSKNLPNLYVYIYLIAVYGALAGCQLATSSTQVADSTALNHPSQTVLPGVSVQLARVATFSLLSTTNGLIRTPAQSKLSFRVSGTLTQIPVHNGSQVSAGQLLAQLDNRDQLLALRVAQDQLAESKVQLRALIAEYGGIDLDTTSIKPNARAYVLTKSGYYKAQTTLAQARQQLQYTELRAPYAGIVANVSTRPYNFITSYEPFCTLLSQAGLVAEFSVLESELAAVQAGQAVRIMPIALPGRRYEGQITELNPYVNAQGLILVKARILHPDSHLFEGMNARIQIERHLPNQLVIPKSAVVERSGRKVVFTVDEGRAKWNYVTIAHENDTQVAISEGLKPGDLVIVSGNLNLGHDAPVQVQQ